MKFKIGERVRVINREQTSADIKSGYFYPFFCGLTGVVDRIYGDEICVNADPDSLPADVLKRHQEIQESVKKKWLNGLSGEARNRLTPEEKRFELSYTILVKASDLEKIGGAKPKETIRSKNASETRSESLPADVKTKSTRTPKAPKPSPKVDASHPVTSKDLEKAEEEYLKRKGMK